MVLKRRLQFLWNYPFFGLPNDYRKILHEDIFTLIYHVSGFNHSDVYNMPIYLRRFYLNTLIDQRKKEEKEVKEAQRRQNSPQDPRLKF